MVSTMQPMGLGVMSTQGHWTEAMHQSGGAWWSWEGLDASGGMGAGENLSFSPSFTIDRLF